MDENQYSRKDFLKIVGISAAALALPRKIFSQTPPYRASIAFQLYTVRREIARDFEGSIRTVADMGYRGVEAYPLPENVTIEKAADFFQKVDLNVFSMHIDLPVGDYREQVVKMAETYHCPNVIYPGWPKGLSAQDPDLFRKVTQIFKTVDDIKRRADLYEEAGSYFKERGLHFGVHNHWWEFEKWDGVIPFYYFLDHLSTNVFFEIDTYWAKTGGQDPAKAVYDFGKRAPFLHIKDGPATQNDKMFANVPVGTGTLDFPAIVKAGGENIKWMIVEFDEYAGNIFDGLQSSYDYLTRNGLADGKV
jgi:sugar phosphate isomerase/epimerase